MSTEIIPTRTDSNNYNYDNYTLSGPGTTEHLVREGYIANETRLHTPRTGNPEANRGVIPSSLRVHELPESQVIKDFDKRKAIIWELRTPTGRELLSYDGRFYYEFLRGYALQAQKWSEARIASGDSNFKRYERKGRHLFELNAEKSREEYTRRNLNLEELRGVYDRALDITPYFSDIDRATVGEGKQVAYFLSNTLSEFETDLQLTNDLRYFTQTRDCLVDYYFGNTRTTADVGFYRDLGGRIRASYDPHMIHRTQPLLDDLLAYGKPEEYAVARLRNGMIQFVIDKALSNRLVKAHGTEEILAQRWNNERIVFTNDFRFDTYPTFEDILDLGKSKYISAAEIFGYGTEEEKK